MRHVIAIDQGTTGSTVLVLDEQLAVRGRGYEEFRQIYPQPGLGRARPRGDLGARSLDALAQALDGASTPRARSPRSASPTSARPRSLWDRATGAPRPPRDRLAGSAHRRRCAELQAAGTEPRVRERTGLVLDPYFSGTKVAGSSTTSRARARAPSAASSRSAPIDSFLVWRLTGGAVHVTDVTNASRTLLLSSHALAWDDELCELFGVPRALLPEIVAVVGRARRRRRAASRPARRHPDRGHRRRSAGGALRSGVLRARRREVHLRHRRLRAHEHRRQADRVEATACSRRSPGSCRRRDRLRARGQRLHRRRRGAVAARRARPHQERDGDRGARARRSPTRAA